MTGQNSPFFLFDDVRVDPSKFQVFKAGNAVQLEPKTLSLLLFLIENRGRLVEKNEILDSVWNGAFVTENALAREVAKLRKALGDDPKAARYIQTVHTRGYRFIADVQQQVSAVEDSTTEQTAVAAEEDLPSAERTPTDVSRSDGRKSRLIPWKAATLISAVLLVLIAGGLLWKKHLRLTQPPPAASIFSVAVLPFKISGGSQNEANLGVEIADALTNRLSNSKHLSVLPLSTVLHFAELNQDPQTVGSALKADFVLYGEIDRSKQHVTTRLIRVRDGTSLLTGNYDEKFSDIFQLEDAVSAKILANLLVTVDHEEMQRMRKRYTENQQAYEAFLTAHYLMSKGSKENELKSIEQFQQAIRLDPKYAMAYAGLSDVYMSLGVDGVAPAEFLPQSRAAAMKAVELDETVAYAHSMLGRIAYQYDWDFARAGHELARARELDPKLTHAWFGSYLLTLNRVSEAEVEQQRFEDFLPYTKGTRQIQHFYFTRQYERAVDALNRKLEANPTFARFHEWLGLVFEQQGRTSEAIAECQKAISLSQGVDGVGALGHIYAVSGRERDAENSLRMLNELEKTIYVSPYEKAVIYAGLGKQDDALKLIEKAYSERSLQPLSVQFDPRLNTLREDPRFRDFMRRTGIP